jgi:hypothetical protein
MQYLLNYFAGLLIYFIFNPWCHFCEYLLEYYVKKWEFNLWLRKQMRFSKFPSRSSIMLCNLISYLFMSLFLWIYWCIIFIVSTNECIKKRLFLFIWVVLFDFVLITFTKCVIMISLVVYILWDLAFLLDSVVNWTDNHSVFVYALWILLIDRNEILFIDMRIEWM